LSEPSARQPSRPYRGVSAADRVAERRERLLDAGLSEYGARGFADTGVKDVCRRAGVTDRYFYESFVNSGELLTAVIDRATERLFGVVAEAVLAAPAEPEPQVRAAIEAFVRELADNPHATRVIFVEAAVAGGAAEAHMRETLRRFAALVAATARPHITQSIPDKLVELGAFSLVGAIERVMIEWEDGHLDVSIDVIVDHLVGMFLTAGALAGVAEIPPSGLPSPAQRGQNG
jgi:AcrR family transcriptional regulator